MWWMIFPISAAIFYCIGNYAQNYIADNVMPKRHAGAYAVMRIPGFILAMVLLYALFHRAVFMLPLYNAVGLMIAGAVNVIGAVYYYKALQSLYKNPWTVCSFLRGDYQLGLYKWWQP